MAGALILAPTVNVFAQNTLQFTGVSATSEKAIQLHWASNSNEVYEIDEADALAGNPDGTTLWIKLYDNYPSHGTNTFIGDFGNYFNAPAILHPSQMPMRFYRAVMTGVNNGSNPTITITSPTNGATVSGNLTVTVSASSDQPIVRTLLYVDGQEMPASDDGSNYVINTCEWPNENHTLFAVARAQSGYEGFPNNRSVTYGQSVSPYVNVAFNNLISKVAFSQPYFEPALGQTQAVTATFAANCNWTLQIQDENSNTVRNASGSGVSMEFDWDGTGDGETNIPDGVYTYLISAQTNGGSFMSMMSGGGGSFSSSARAAVSSVEEATELWALPENGESFVPLALYPPGLDTNGFTIIQASQSQVQALTEAVMAVDRPAIQAKSAMMDSESGGGFSFNADSSSSAYAGPASQSTAAPTRPPTSGVKGAKGTYGVAYLQYLPSGFTGHGPPTGLPFPLTQYIAVDGHSANGNVDDAQVIVFKETADRFENAMQNGGWKRGFRHANNDFAPADLKKTSLGGNGIFNTVNIGITMTHGSFATATTPSDPVLNTYWWFSANNQVKLADCSFGSSGTNGLRWMALLGCSLLRDDNYQSMYNHLKLPINNNLHLLLGASTYAGATADIGELWAKKMTKGGFFTGPEPVWDAWYHAGQDAYHYATNIDNSLYPGPWYFRAAGWPNCFGDKLKEYSDPNSGNPANITHLDSIVYPYP